MGSWPAGAFGGPRPRSLRRPESCPQGVERRVERGVEPPACLQIMPPGWLAPRPPEGFRFLAGSSSLAFLRCMDGYRQARKRGRQGEGNHAASSDQRREGRGVTAVGIPLDRRVGAQAPPRRSRYRPTRPIAVRRPGVQRGGQPAAPVRRPRGSPAALPAGSRVIIVDDGSSDGTAALVERYDGPLPVELVRLGENQGPGAAFRAGFEAALDGAAPTRRSSSRSRPTRRATSTRSRTMLAARPAGADLVLASVHGGGTMVNVSRMRRAAQPRRRRRRPAGARPRRPHRLVVLPRLPRVASSATRSARYGDEPHRGARLRLQGGAAREARARSARGSKRSRSTSTRPGASARARCRSCQTTRRLLAPRSSRQRRIDEAVGRVTAAVGRRSSAAASSG